MRKFILIAFAASLLVTNQSQAGFIMKKQPAKVAVESVATSSDAAVVTSTPAVVAEMPKEAVKKQSLMARMFAPHKGGGAEISKALYVVLAIIGFGWLGMGINDNFEDWDWVLSLVLYIIFYLPGLIYTLVKMKKYYK